MSDQPANTNREEILRRTLLEIKSMRAKTADLERMRSEPIAITGMACRFPGDASSPERFWQILNDGIDTVVEVPRDRWDVNAWWDPDPNAPGTMYTRSGAFLKEDLSAFDAEFFRISPREADSLDPQQRLLLEVAWEALEDAGEAPGAVNGSAVGVFLGISTNDYAQFTMYGDPAAIEAYTATGNALNAAAGRIAYFLGSQGPALAIDTACSSSLVAVHLACQSLRNDDCSVALVGGVNLMLTPNGTIATSRARMMAHDGRCKTFDATADGYGRGEGCALIVLKRVSDAIAHGDRILALIRGSAINQNGASSALTVPNGHAQQMLIRKALSRSRVSPASLSFFEAHGTGTALGDPIEVESIQAVLADGREAGNLCALGAVKTNLGHLEAAAGIAGLMKVALSMCHETVPPNLHLERLNSRISLDRTRFTIPIARQPWLRTAVPRLAGVSSFGFSGTNAHVIVEEGPVLAARGAETRPHHILVLSAKSEAAVGDLVQRYRAALQPELDPGDVCFTASAGRSHFSHRIAVTGADCEELRAQLGSGFHTGVAGRPRIALLFTGQGSQYKQMGRQLYETHPVFRKVIEECEEHLGDILPEPLREVLYGNKTELLDQTAYTQPALFALEYGLAELWRSWGIEPVAVVGHSVGEYVAASVAGVLSMAEGIRLLGHRGRLVQQLPAGGAMTAIRGREDRVRRAVESSHGRLSVAAWNGPLNGVISGDVEEIERVERELKAEGISAQRLRVSHAFHSVRMEPAMEEFEKHLRQVKAKAPQLRWIGNLTGEQMTQAPDAGYWLCQMREPVQFEKSMRMLQAEGCDVLVEAGPSPVLLGMGQHCWSDAGKGTAWLPSLRKGVDDWRQMLDSLAELYVRGCRVDWESLDKPWPRRRIALPTYPFQRKRFWIEQAEPSEPEQPSNNDSWLYRLEWRESSRVSSSESSVQSMEWLIFADKVGFGARLAESLEECGDSCVLVYPDPALLTLEGIREIVLRHPHCNGIIHLWSLDTECELAHANLRDCGSILHLVQSLVAAAAPEPPRLWVVTPSSQSVVSAETSLPAAATLWGLGRVIALEHPELWGGLIDLASDFNPSLESSSEPSSNEQIEQVAAEVRQSGGDNQVAFRSSQRYVPRLVHTAALPSATVGEVSPRPDVTYLITGGLGSLGLALAQWLVERGARHLLLTSRRPPSEVAATKIESLQKQDVSVRFVACDVSNAAEVASLLAGIDPGIPLAGIFHAAGTLDDGILLNQDWNRFSAVMAPKVQGAWNLHLATSSLDLDFFVMFSSAAGLLGSPGQGNYAAANAFLDALANHRVSLGLKSLSVDWGPWSEFGMAAELARRSSRQWRPRGIDAIDPELGFSTLWRLLATNDPQVMALLVDWKAFGEQFPISYKAGMLSELIALEPEKTPEKSVMRLKIEAAPVVQRRDLLIDVIQEAIAATLGVSRTEVPSSGNPEEQRFFELGLDSLMAVELRNDLVNQLGIALPATALFQHPTTLAFANYLAAMPEFSEAQVSHGMPLDSKTPNEDEFEGASEEELLDLLAQELAQR